MSFWQISHHPRPLDANWGRGRQAGVIYRITCGHDEVAFMVMPGLGRSRRQACRDGHAVAHHRVPRLFDARAIANGDRRDARMLRAIRIDALILDDWWQAVLTPAKRRDLLEILEDRTGPGSTIVTSQLPGEHWHKAVGKPRYSAGSIQDAQRPDTDEGETVHSLVRRRCLGLPPSQLPTRNGPIFRGRLPC